MSSRPDVGPRPRAAGRERPRRRLALSPSVGILIFLAVPFQPAPAPAQVLNFRNYTTTEGLPAAQILALHQDARNYIWIGTYAGLSRFNGAEFRTWDASAGLGSNAISAIAEDIDGRLHVGSVDRICTLADRAIRCIGQAEGLPGGQVQDILVDVDGRSLWVATEQGVAHVTGGAVRAYGEAEGVPGVNAQRFVRDRNGVLWATGNKGIARWDGTRFVRAFGGDVGGRAVSVIVDTRWGLMFAVGARLFLARDGVVGELALPRLAGTALITDAAVDAAGKVWIGTHAGVLHYDGAGFASYTTGNGLLFNLVNRVRVDREGNVWVGTDRGLSRLTPGPFRHYSHREGLPNPVVRALTLDTAGRLWLGTRDGVAVREGDSIRVVDLGDQLSERRIFSLAGLPDGSVLVGSRGGGLLHHDGRRVLRVYGEADGLPGTIVTALLVDSTGGAWVGTNRGLVRWQNGRLLPAPGAPLGDAAFILSLAADARGRIWLGMRGSGVRIYDGRSTTALGARQGVTDQHIWAMARDRDGAMWLATNGDGVIRINPDDVRDIRRLTTANGLINDFVWQVQRDAEGALWFYTSRGLDRLTADGIQHYGRGRGLLELEGAVNASLMDANGELWLGTGAGVVRYTPALDVPSAVRPIVHIEDIVIGSDTLRQSGARLRAPGRLVTASYASPTFRDETLLRYRYRMLGVNANWSDATADRDIGYAGLGPGTYEFQVYAVDASGRSSEVAALAFLIAPQFWQTWWFRAAGVALLLAVITVIIGARSRAANAERLRLEAIVATRTRELSARNMDLVREVADRQRAEDALRLSQQRLLEVVEYSTNMFYSHDTDGVITYVSPQSRRILGCEPEEALRRFHEFVTDNPVNASGLEATAQAIRTGVKQPPYEMELCGANGELHWVQVNEAPVTRDGETIRIVGSLTDITEAKHAAAEQERLQLQLRQAQKMEAVGRLAGGIAHDFNNLLTAVVGNTELVAAGLEPNHPLQADLAQVRQAADRAASLVSQLLAFSRQQLIRRRVLDLNTVVSDAARMLRRMIGADIELQLELAAEPLFIQADQAQLEQVVMNLAINARDAMPDGGRLIIATDAVQLEERHLHQLENDVAPGRYAALRVIDTGHGMDAETIRHAFEPFYTTKAIGKGTGLGLATVYGIITQNGGGVRIDSTTERGTTFHVFLPCVPAADEHATVPAPMPCAAVDEAEPQDTAERAVVLVVEDEDAVRRLVCRTLQRHGYEVLEASDGAQALHTCSEHGRRIGLLLTDMVMPGLNGRQVADRVRQAHPQARVLYMSGHTNEFLGSRFMLDEQTHVLEKPFSPADLVQRVRAILTEQHA